MADKSRSPRRRSRSPPRGRRDHTSPRRGRSPSPPRARSPRREPSREQEQPAASRRRSSPSPPQPPRRGASAKPEPEPEVWGSHLDEPQPEPPAEEEEKKVHANFETSGLLTAETNTYRGVVLKYNEPQDAATPKLKWRLHGFKGDEELPVIHLHRQSAFMIGKEHKVCEIPLDHPSVSKQHAVLQFRKIPDALSNKIRVKLYVIDLASTNGTLLNGERIEPQRYYEAKEKDLLKFGFSSREYVVLNDQSVDDDDD